MAKINPGISYILRATNGIFKIGRKESKAWMFLFGNFPCMISNGRYIMENLGGPDKIIEYEEQIKPKQIFLENKIKTIKQELENVELELKELRYNVINLSKNPLELDIFLKESIKSLEEP